MVVEFTNFYPLFSLQISIFDNKNLFKNLNPCVLLAPATKNPLLKRPEREKNKVKHVIRS